MDEYRGLDTVARNSESWLQVRPMTNDRQIKQIHNVGTICDIVKKYLITMTYVWIVAERQGFEPWVPLQVQRISNPSRSTTPAPLRT